MPLGWHVSEKLSMFIKNVVIATVDIGNIIILFF